MMKLQNEICRNKLPIMVRLGASEIQMLRRTTELLPDFNLVNYGGLADQDYPIWQEFSFSQTYTYIHRICLRDYGYFIEDDEVDTLYKHTSGSGEFNSPGRLDLMLQTVDRFACRAFVRGRLHGSSAEMNMDVAFVFDIAGYSSPSEKLGYAAEAMAEGFAFENEGRLKQAFFSYFTALDSFLDAEREKLNRGIAAPDQIPANERLAVKLSKVAKANLVEADSSLNNVKIWGGVVEQFKLLERRRNAIAHNTQDLQIEAADVDACFSIFVILVAMISDQCFEEGDIRRACGIDVA